MTLEEIARETISTWWLKADVSLSPRSVNKWRDLEWLFTKALQDVREKTIQECIIKIENHWAWIEGEKNVLLDELTPKRDS